jgi:hypothetical protein
MRDPEEERHVKKARKKRFGLKSGAYTSWYATKKARDQAEIDLRKHTCNLLTHYGVIYYEKVTR